MRLRLRTLTVVVAAALVAAGCGSAGEDGSSETTSAVPVDQTVEVSMVELAFRPDVITVKAGTTVRFVFENDGQALHEAHFGDQADQDARDAGKQSLKGVEVSPNGTKSYVMTFSNPGTLIIGCHVPGHYKGGMIARLLVE